MCEPTLRVTTESGSVYEFADGMARVRRVAGAESNELRRDGEWTECVESFIAIGEGMRLYLNGVAETGETLRLTTPVVSIEGVEDEWHH